MNSVATKAIYGYHNGATFTLWYQSEDGGTLEKIVARKLKSKTFKSGRGAIVQLPLGQIRSLIESRCLAAS